MPSHSPEETRKIRTKAMCIVIRNGKDVLATLGEDTVKGEKFGRIIGGGIEFGETSLEALQREFVEELDTKLENLEFLRVVENIFSFNDLAGHEIVFLYKGDLAKKDIYEKGEIKILDADTRAVWIPLDDVYKGRMKLYPKFDYKGLLEKK